MKANQVLVATVAVEVVVQVLAQVPVLAQVALDTSHRQDLIKKPEHIFRMQLLVRLACLT